MRRAEGEPGRLAMPRRRGALTGMLIVILGAWCAVIPFIGPSFNFTIGADNAFDMTWGRFWLSLVPGVVAVVGGLMLLQAANRATATLGAQLAIAAGAWLVVGPTVSMLWNDGASQAGPALGGTDKQVLEMLLYFYATGAAITALAGIGLGRVSARHEGDYERLATPAATTTGAAAVEGERARGGRFGRGREVVARDRDGDGVPDDREVVARDRDGDGVPDDREAVPAPEGVPADREAVRTRDGIRGDEPAATRVHTPRT